MVTKAKESSTIKKARNKLKKQLQEDRKQFNPQMLSKIITKLEFELARGASDRIDLKNREIRLFDENKHSAAIRSRFIQNIKSAL